MKIHNHYYNTYPLIIHNPFEGWNDCKLWDRVVICNFGKITIPENLTLVTWNNSQELGLIEKQLKRNKINYLSLGKDVEWSTNRMKPLLLIDNFHLIKTKYILCMDCFDVFIVGDLKNILDRFLKKNAKVLFNATGSIYPNDPSDKKIEDKMCPPPFRYFNSGLFIGEANYIENMLTSIDWDCKQQHYSDQFLMRKKYHDCHPDVQIDWNCEIFQIGLLTYPNPPIEKYVEIKECSLL